jgi:hypothetical protein
MSPNVPNDRSLPNALVPRRDQATFGADRDLRVRRLEASSRRDARPRREAHTVARRGVEERAFRLVTADHRRPHDVDRPVGIHGY